MGHIVKETLDDNDDDDIIDSFSFDADAMIAIPMACALAIDTEAVACED